MASPPLQDAASPSLVRAYTADLLAAAGAGFVVAPMVSVVDRAMAENASGKQRLITSVQSSLRDIFFKAPEFFRSPQFLWMWLVFSSTYAAANVVDTTTKARKMDTKSTGAAMWFSTTLVNTSTGIAKDRAYARMFGTKSAERVPIGSYAAWLSRDAFFMGICFVGPPIIGRLAAESLGSERAGYYAAQFGLPIAGSFIGTPLHLLGMDVYNNPNNTVGQRLQFLKKDYFKNVSLAVVRLIPPWSLGTIGNTEARGFLLRKLQ